MPNVRKQLSVCDKLSSSLSIGLELIYFLSKYAYNLSLSRQKKCFQQSLAGYPSGNPKEIGFNLLCGLFAGMTLTQETSAL